MISITVYADPAPLSPNAMALRHWGMRSKLAKAARSAGRSAWLVAHRPKARPPLRIDVRVYRTGRKLDHDNLIASLKHYIDGLFNKAVCDTDANVEIGLVTQILMPGNKRGEMLGWIARMEFDIHEIDYRNETSIRRIYGKGAQTGIATRAVQAHGGRSRKARPGDGAASRRADRGEPSVGRDEESPQGDDGGIGGADFTDCGDDPAGLE
jgi:hypothetical protein